MHITLVLPVYNEQKNIKDVILDVKKIVNRIIIIDNNSSDDTVKIIKKLNKINIQHCFNLGKSNSLKTGCDLAIKLKTDLIAFMDSDGQHKGSDLKRLIETIKKERIDAVIGYRDSFKMPMMRGIGTLLIKILTNFLFNSSLNDIQSGMRVFKSKIYQRIKWTSTGSAHYFADAEISTKLIKQKIRFKEVAIKTIFLDKYKGMNIFQGIHLLFCLMMWRFNS
jgi:glycosyltransferase involved in cell wall biosynthesis